MLLGSGVHGECGLRHIGMEVGEAMSQVFALLTREKRGRRQSGCRWEDEQHVQGDSVDCAGERRRWRGLQTKCEILKRPERGIS